MSAVSPVPFIGGASLSRSRNFDAQRCINLIPQASGSGQSKSVAMLLGSPGLRLLATLAGGLYGVRGAIRFTAQLAFVVVGANVYALTSAFASTLIGTIVPRYTPVSMASNGVSIMMVCGSEGYVITPNALMPGLSTIAPITDPAFTGADRVDFIDNYFVINKSGTEQFQITGLLTTNFAALDFASAEGAPDLLISLIVNQREIWLPGETSTEIFFNSGNNDFPFERIQGAFIEQGCAAKNSVAKADGSVFLLSADEHGQGIAVRSQGYSFTPISKPEQVFAWAQYPTIADAIGFTYQQEGQTFYMLHFPTGNETWAYGLSSELWHQRAWRNPLNASLNRHRSNCMMAFAGEIVVGDWENGNLYALDLDVYDDNGAILPAIRQAPHFASETNTNYIFDRFWIDLEAGVGLPSGQGSDPVIMIEWSDDGGHSFPMQRMVPIGKVGEYGRRAIVKRSGRSRDRVWRATITDPVKRVLIGAGATVRQCSS